MSLLRLGDMLKTWIGILGVVLLLSACSSTRMQKFQEANLTEHDILRADIQQYQSADSLKLIQLQRDIILHRQTMLKYDSDLDKLNKQLENILNSPLMKLSSADLDSLKIRMQAMQTVIAQQADLLTFTSDRITTVLEDATDNSTRVVNLQKQVDAIRQLVESAAQDKANPQTDSYQSQLSELRSQLAELKAYINKPDPPQAAPALPKEKTSPAQPTVNIDKPKLEVQTKQQVTAPSNPDLAARAMYEKARATYEKRGLNKAVAQFKAFLKQYPDHELASNAQYWLGETYFAAEEYQKAIEELGIVISRYNAAPKAPDAQYKIGMSYLRLKDKANAKTALEKIHRLYPDYERMSLVDKQLSSFK